MSRKNFTLCELLFCLVITVCLVAVLTTAAEAAVEKAKTATCTEQLHGILKGVLAYSADNDDHIPPEHDTTPDRHYFIRNLRNYVAPSAWLCPDQSFCSAFFDNGTRVNGGVAVSIADTSAKFKVSYGYSEAYDGRHDYREYSPCQSIDITNCVSPTILFACSNNTKSLMFECGPYATPGNAAEFPDKVVPRSTGDVGTCRLGMKYIHNGDTGNFAFSDGHVETLKDTTFQQWMTFL